MSGAAVVIPNWNGESLLPTCLKALRETRVERLSTIVVDNGSTDGSAALVKRDFPWVRWLPLGSNLGFAKACNAGIKNALAEDDPEYVVLFNNDVEAREPDWLKWMIKAAQADPAAGVVGCRLIYPDGRDQELGKRLTPTSIEGLLETPGWKTIAEPYAVDAAVGAVFLMTRRLIETVGLLDEGFFLGMEDIDYCLRARRAGFRVKIAPSARVVHLRSQSINRESPGFWFRLDRETELRFRLLNNPLWTAPFVAVSEARVLAAHVFPRTGRGRTLSPDWRKFVSGTWAGYGAALRCFGDLLRKRWDRAGRQWY